MNSTVQEFRSGQVHSPLPARTNDGDTTHDLVENAWLDNTKKVEDQSPEVLQRAKTLFLKVVKLHGLVTGLKGRALCLVCLLYATRQVHGNNNQNEAYLIRLFNVSTRVMNRRRSKLVCW